MGSNVTPPAGHGKLPVLSRVRLAAPGQVPQLHRAAVVSPWSDLPAGLMEERSHSFTVPSRLPEARRFPSGLKATENTKSSCPLMTILSLPVATSQTGTVLSKFPEATRFPSGLKATEHTSSGRKATEHT